MNTIVTESSEHGEIAVDVYQKLANDRILFICDFINDKLAADITATLLLKNSENSEQKITLFINSHGGDIRNVFMIYDVMNLVSCPIETVCIGAAMDEVALILAAGAPGMRLATKNAIIAVGPLVHDYMTISDLTDAKQALTLSSSDNKKMMEALAKCTDKSIKVVTDDFERKTFMTANQAVKYGLIDKVIAIGK